MGKALTYLGYAKSGKEFEVKQALADLGITAHCPIRVDFVRKGKRRFAEAVESPYLNNYLFIEATAEQFHQALTVKFLASTLCLLSPREVSGIPERTGKDGITLKRIPGLVDFLAAAQGEYDEAMRIVSEAEKEAERINRNRAMLSQYKPGQAVKLLNHALSEQMFVFKRMVERSSDPFPKVQMEAEMFGRAVTVEADPLDVRPA